MEDKVTNVYLESGLLATGSLENDGVVVNGDLAGELLLD